jgi:transposase InsO family protein
VAQVLADLLRGYPRAESVRRAAGTDWWTPEGVGRRVSERTLYRWLKAYEDHDLAGLEPATRRRTDSSLVLSERFLKLLADYKRADPTISIPEVIAVARELGVLAADERVDRSTVYRAASRMGLPVQRRKKSGPNRDMRRFAFPHRMDCILCDGKHFRAGVSRARRVAFFYLDDATRCGLHVVVGTSENAKLFLRGLFETVRKRGIPTIVYIDHGSGFIAHDTLAVIKALGGVPIHGETAYPQGHGKIEKLNQTALNRVLASLDGRVDVDPSCAALELRLRHWLRERYNHTPHASLSQDTPWQRWEADPKPLRLADNEGDLRGKFIVTLERGVSSDNVVPVDGIDYEMPRGYAGTRVTLYRRLLDDRIACLHEGTLVDLAPVDLAANARAKRAQPSRPAEVTQPLPLRAADIAFQRDFAPVVDTDGGYTDDFDSQE